jgi:hypothetical protein
MMPDLIQVDKLHQPFEFPRLHMLLDPRFRPAEDEKGKRERMGCESVDEVEDANLDAFLVFGIPFLNSRFLIRIDAFVESVDNDQPVGHVLGVSESLEGPDDQLRQLYFQSLGEDHRVSLDGVLDMRGEFGDGNEKLVSEGDDKPCWTVPILSRPPEKERRADEIEIKLCGLLLQLC